MEKRFCPVIGRTIYLQPKHNFLRIPEEVNGKISNPCACVSKNGKCTNYFSGCCNI